MERMLLPKNTDYLEGELSYSVNYRQSPPPYLSGNLLFWGQPLWFALLAGCQGFSPAGALEEWSLNVTLWLLRHSGTACILLISSPTQELEGVAGGDALGPLKGGHGSCCSLEIKRRKSGEYSCCFCCLLPTCPFWPLQKWNWHFNDFLTTV